MLVLLSAIGLGLISSCTAASAAEPAPVASVPENAWGVSVIGIDFLNARSTPEIRSDNIEWKYYEGASFVIFLDTQTYNDGYYWYMTNNGVWVADTGCFRLESQLYVDTLTVTHPDGTVAAKHTCCYLPDNDFLYYLEVDEDWYEVSCDCGWTFEATYHTQVYDAEGGWLKREEFILGFDTGYDEIPDAMPYGLYEIRHPKQDGKRDLNFLLFNRFVNYDPPAPDAPVITVRIVDADGNPIYPDLICEYYMDIWAYDYGIVVQYPDGRKIIIPGDIRTSMVLRFTDDSYDILTQFGYLTPTRIEPYNRGDYMQTDFVLEYISLGDINDEDGWFVAFLQHLIGGVNDVGTWLDRVWNSFLDLFDFLFKRDDSPFWFIIGGGQA